jgi:hypothetical protein
MDVLLGNPVGGMHTAPPTCCSREKFQKAKKWIIFVEFEFASTLTTWRP